MHVSAITKILNSPYFLWALLALPSVPMVAGLVSGSADAERLLHPTGEFAARFMIIAMAITPLRMAFPKARWPVWLMRRRRWFGVAAFLYAVAHTVLYIVDLQTLKAMLDEFFALGIWTGWAAFAIFLPLGLTSNDAAQRALLGWWQPLQRWVYGAALFTLLHWMFVHNNIGPALVHFVPLAALQAFRIWKLVKQKPRPGPAGAPS